MEYRRIALSVGGAVLLAATLVAFLAFDRDSHSASDTLRPFIIAMAPAWLLAGWAARLLMRRAR